MDGGFESIDELCQRLGARAAGLWRLDGDRLGLIALGHAPDLPRRVASGFVESVASVGLDQVELGIVRAATSGRPIISKADELPADLGSGRWLRAFGASRSVAVQFLDSKGRVQAVASIALPSDSELTDDQVVAQLRSWRDYVMAATMT